MKEAFERMYASYVRGRQPGERYDQDFEVLRRRESALSWDAQNVCKRPQCRFSSGLALFFSRFRVQVGRLPRNFDLSHSGRASRSTEPGNEDARQRLPEYRVGATLRRAGHEHHRAAVKEHKGRE
jgi:hypothetical protein